MVTRPSEVTDNSQLLFVASGWLYLRLPLLFL